MSIRIVSKFDIKPPNVVKPVFFEGLRVVGNPSELANKYYLDGIDELYYIDVVASLYQTDIDLELVSKVAKDIFIPLSVGGGVKTVQDFSSLIHNGADKVSMNSYAITNPSLINQTASIFGSQAVVVSVEAKKTDSGWVCFTDGGKINRHKDIFAWVDEVEKRGAGEIFLQSIDKDGFKSGFDLELARKVVEQANVPVVIGSGAGTIQHLEDVIKYAKPSEVAIASLLHTEGFTVEKIKKELQLCGIEVCL